MLRRQALLVIDAAINLALGLFLWWYPPQLALWLGLPTAPPNFFARILGGVLVGIGLALLIQRRSRDPRVIGLGLAGAIAINMSAGLTLAGLLLLTDLTLTTPGLLILGPLAVLLIGLSALEFRELA